MSRNAQVHPLTAAKFYLSCGFSLVPILANGSKQPAVAWKPYALSRPSATELEEWFSRGDKGIALIQGEVSGNSEILEFESEEAYTHWFNVMCERGNQGIAESLNLCVYSPGGGVHLFYRHNDEPQGNQRLASTRSRIEGHKQGKDGQTTLIETRGQGGYVLVPGCLPECHPSGRLYRLAQGSSFARVPRLTAEQRITVFDACRALDERPAPLPKPKPARAIEVQSSGDALRPGDDFNERGAVEALACLERHGWSIAADHGDWQELCRPGKTRGGSATFGYVAPGVLHVFSSNAAPFEMDSTIGPFEIVTALDFGGDYKACARMLGARGFGSALPVSTATSTKSKAGPAVDSEEHKAALRQGREKYTRLIAVLRLCELGLITDWPEAMPGAGEELLRHSKTMGLADSLEALFADLNTDTRREAWLLLTQIDDLMDGADVYVDNADCVMFYMDWLESRFSQEAGQ